MQNRFKLNKQFTLPRCKHNQIICSYSSYVSRYNYFCFCCNISNMHKVLKTVSFKSKFKEKGKIFCSECFPKHINDNSN